VHADIHHALCVLLSPPRRPLREHYVGATLASSAKGQGFHVASVDRRRAPAQACIGDRIVLSHPAVAAPVAARHAGVNNASQANVVGGDGLPLPPLRTDNGPLESAGRRRSR
jgi:sialate O-acetylesterase